MLQGGVGVLMLSVSVGTRLSVSMREVYNADVTVRVGESVGVVCGCWCGRQSDWIRT